MSCPGCGDEHGGMHVTCSECARGCTCSVNDWIICPYCSNFVDSYTNPIEKEKRERLFTAVRRWWRRLGDWLDPHAAHRRDYAEFQRLWLGQWRSGLDGREPGPEGRER